MNQIDCGVDDIILGAVLVNLENKAGHDVDVDVDVDIYKHDPFHAFNFSIPGNYVQSDFPLYNYYQ